MTSILGILFRPYETAGCGSKPTILNPETLKPGPYPLTLNPESRDPGYVTYDYEASICPGVVSRMERKP